MKNPNLIAKLLIGATVLLLIIVSISTNRKRNSSNETAPSTESNKVEEETYEVEKAYVNQDSINISNFYEELRSFNPKSYDQKDGISIITRYQNVFTGLKTGVNNDAKLKKAKDLLKKKLSEAYPYYRKLMVRASSEALWEKNIKVTGTGSTITFTGGVFANHANIKAFETDIEETLNNFRFKRVNYKWYDYDDEYTYYSLSNPKDSEIK